MVAINYSDRSGTSMHQIVTFKWPRPKKLCIKAKRIIRRLFYVQKLLELFCQKSQIVSRNVRIL